MLSQAKIRLRRILNACLIAGVCLLAIMPATAFADPVPSYTFATPVFGVDAAPDGSLLVADSGSGIVELRKGAGSLVTPLPGITDVAAIGRGAMFAITGNFIGDAGKRLYRVSRDTGAVEIANLGAFEALVNPDGGQVDSNPFDVAVLNGGTALVADAGGNDLLVVDGDGNVDWVASLPNELAPTDNLKATLGCPNPPPGLEFACFLPPVMPAQPVATSIAIGPDGAYYVGELKGFPGPTGMSKVWRIEPGTRHAKCGTSDKCKVVANGFTSIVDLAFGPDGTLYVVEFDEASFISVELTNFGIPAPLKGGTVNACTPGAATWSCHEVATGLTLPIGVTVDKTGQLYAAVESLMPSAHVTALP